MKDSRPSDESWSQKIERLEIEAIKRQESFRGEPKSIKISKSLKFDSMFGWINKVIDFLKKRS